VHKTESGVSCSDGSHSIGGSEFHRVRAETAERLQRGTTGAAERR